MVDKVTLKVKAGDGGDGLMSLKRIKYNSKAGPDGGNGGDGGSGFVIGKNNIRTLFDYRKKSSYLAQNGERGITNFRNGKNGKDIYLYVPLGTVIYKSSGPLPGEEVAKGDLLGEVMFNNQSLLLIKGGKGGLGNAHFKSSIDRTPRKYTKGSVGETLIITMELKLLADIGIVGLPSVGKSTLINSLTLNSFKTASYHFTTLSPNLAVLKLSQGRELTISDLPGLIEGASSGKGLGREFLRHVERCGMLLHVLDLGSYYGDNKTNVDDILNGLKKDYINVRNEIGKWSSKILNKKEVVLLNKSDIVNNDRIVDEVIVEFKKYLSHLGFKSTPVFKISALESKGIDDIINYLSIIYDELSRNSYTLLNNSLKNFRLITVKNIPNRRVLFYSKN